MLFLSDYYYDIYFQSGLTETMADKNLMVPKSRIGHHCASWPQDKLTSVKQPQSIARVKNQIDAS